MARRDATETREPPRLPDSSPLARVELESDADQACETTAPVVLIGSRRDCALTLSHGDVSQTHLALVNTGVSIVAVDLCSRTGTFVNNQRVAVATLKPGDKLRIGSLDLRLDFPRPPESSGDAPQLASPLKLSGGVSTELKTLPAVIGRRQGCAVTIDTPDVSLAHALLIAIEGMPAIVDLGSRSGIILNRRRATEAWLHDGDELSIGGEKVKVGWKGPVGGVEQPDEPAPAERRSTPAPAPVAAAPATVPLAAAAAPELDFGGDTQAALAALEQHLAALAVSLRTRVGEADSRMQEVEAATNQVTLERQRLDQERLWIESERRRLDSVASDLDAQRDALKAEETAFRLREAEVAAAAAKIEQFKSALNETANRLVGLESAAKPQAPFAAVAARAKTAPIVDRPMFGAAQPPARPG